MSQRSAGLHLQGKLIYAPPRLWHELAREAQVERRSFRDWVLMILEQHGIDPNKTCIQRAVAGADSESMRITIFLSDAEAEALEELADRERRTVRQQATVLVLQALGRFHSVSSAAGTEATSQ